MMNSRLLHRQIALHEFGKGKCFTNFDRKILKGRKAPGVDLDLQGSYWNSQDARPCSGARSRCGHFRAQ
jgi:hypothetical protein